MMRGWLASLSLFIALGAGLLAQGKPVTPGEVQAIAEEAYTFAYPMLENYQRFFRGGPDPSIAMNRLVHARQLAGPQSRNVIRPNNDTLYSSTWLDLRATPVAITMPPVPDGRYWSIQILDIYTHNAAIFSPRNAASTGGRFVIAGPSWQGPPPAGVLGFIRAESQFVFALVRLAVLSPEDISNVAQLQNAMQITRLDPAAAPPAAVTFPPFNREKADSEGFIEYLNFLLSQLAVHDSEKALMTRFSQIGIGANRPFDPAAIDVTTRGAIRLGVQAAREKINSGRNAFRQPRGGWTTADALFGNRDRMQGQYQSRALAARAGLWGLDREEAVYMNAGVDAGGNRLDASTGGYVLRFGPKDLPPSKAFWSITMYAEDGFMAANPMQRYSIGDRTPGLQRDPDGGLTIWISAQSPGLARETNWLPTPPGLFTLALRIYLPDDSVMKYIPPPVKRV